jgi:uncharacterized membrane protein (UPF0182 family)
VESRTPAKLLRGLLLVVVLCIIALGTAARTYTDALWFSSLGLLPVFMTKLYARLALLVAVALIATLFIWLNVRFVKRQTTSKVELLGRRLLQPGERAMIDRYYLKLRFWFCLAAGIIAGLMAASRWQDALLFFNSVAVGKTDPIFNLDLAFYLFKFRFWYFLASSFYMLSLGTLLLTALLHIYEENIRFVTSRPNVSAQARGQLGFLFGCLLIGKAATYWLKRYVYLYPHADVTSGATWVDAHIGIPVTGLLAILALLVGLLFMLSGKPNLTRPAFIGLILLITVSIVGKSIAPAIMQRFTVAPNELAREEQYIKHGIEATRTAFGLDKFDAAAFPAEMSLTAGDLDSNVDTLRNVRLWADEPALQVYNQLQEIRTYYSFPDIDSDRYDLPGHGYRQVLISAREMNSTELRKEARELWVNKHLVYTHGYGLCISPVNVVRGEEGSDSEGLPAFWSKDIPSLTEPGLEVKEPRIYYGEGFSGRLYEQVMTSQQAPMASPMAGPEGMNPMQQQMPQTAPPRPFTPVDSLYYLVTNTKQPEFDYPEENVQTPLPEGTVADEDGIYGHYQGTGGILLDSFLKRLAFAIRFTDVNLLLSGYITPESRLMMYRAVRERAEMAAPFLTYDADAYPVIADGKIYWMIDGYATSLFYPYSSVYSRLFNYIRNSVKVVSSAHEGELNYYVMDNEDPVTKVWMKIYPSLFKPYEQMPEGLKSHIRYPKGLFQAQASMYRLFHMTSASQFYSKEDAWEFPQQQYGDNWTVMEPHYLIMKLPGRPKAEFMLLMPFTPAGKENMIGWMAAHCDWPEYGNVTVFKFPKSKNTYGPRQVENRIQQNTDIAQAFTLWKNQNTRVLRGDLQVIPIDKSVLYVEPVYIVAAEQGLPELKRIIVAYGDEGENIAMAPTLADALRQIFGAGKKPDRVAPSAATGATEAAAVSPQTDALIIEAANAYEKAEAASRAGDWKTFGDEMAKLKNALKQLEAQRKQ